MNWMENLQSAIAYIEENLTEEIKVRDVAEKAYVSEFHFQRIFSALCGISVGEYIRNRRLSIAGSELATTDAKVIDVALKYGYESPDSFAKAFKQFHGVLPSQVKCNGGTLKSFAFASIRSLTALSESTVSVSSQSLESSSVPSRRVNAAPASENAFAFLY